MNGLTMTLIYYPIVSIGWSSDSLAKAIIRVWVGCVPFWRLMGESVFPFTQAANRVQFRAVARLGSCFLAGCLLEWLSVS